MVGDDGRAFEVQIRTQEMHQFAEYGVAAHWRYKEAGARGYGGQVTASEKYDEKIAWLRQLLAWKDDVSEGEHGEKRAAQPWEQLRQATLDDDHIYVLTPQARVIRVAARCDAPSTSLITCTASSGIAAAARASMARWCRSTRRCKTARRSRSSR